MKEIIYIGGYSNSIKVCEFENGFLKIVNEISNIQKPSYLNVNQDVLYAVSETNIGAISSYKILNNNLIELNTQVIYQSLPCYLSSNIRRDSLVIANFGSGSICMYELFKDGKIGNNIVTKQYQNSHMHFSKFVKDYIYGIDLANDLVFIYNKNLDKIISIQTPKNSGPRHAIIFNDYLFIVTELSNEILLYKRNEHTYILIQKISTLKTNNIQSYAGAIKISDDKKNIYVTNRGENTISVFSFVSNKLNLIQSIPCWGNFPRDLILDKTQEYVLVANQKSNNRNIRLWNGYS